MAEALQPCLKPPKGQAPKVEHIHAAILMARDADGHAGAWTDSPRVQLTLGSSAFPTRWRL